MMKIVKKLWNFLHLTYVPIFGFFVGLQPFFKNEVNTKDLICFAVFSFLLAVLFQLGVFLYHGFKKEFSLGKVKLRIVKGDLLQQRNSLILIPYIDNQNIESGESLYSKLKSQPNLKYKTTDVPHIGEVCSLNGSKFYCLKVMTVKNGGTSELTLKDFYSVCFKIGEALDRLSTLNGRETIIYIPNIASRYKISELEDIDRILELMNILSKFNFAREVNITLVLSSKKSWADVMKFKRMFSITF